MQLFLVALKRSTMQSWEIAPSIQLSYRTRAVLKVLLSKARVVPYGWLLIIDTAEGKVHLNIEIKIHCLKGSVTCRRLYFFFKFFFCHCFNPEKGQQNEYPLDQSSSLCGELPHPAWFENFRFVKSSWSPSSWESSEYCLSYCLDFGRIWAPNFGTLENPVRWVYQEPGDLWKSYSYPSDLLFCALCAFLAIQKSGIISEMCCCCCKLSPFCSPTWSCRCVSDGGVERGGRRSNVWGRHEKWRWIPLTWSQACRSKLGSFPLILRNVGSYSTPQWYVAKLSSCQQQDQGKKCFFPTILSITSSPYARGGFRANVC